MGPDFRKIFFGVPFVYIFFPGPIAAHSPPLPRRRRERRTSPAQPSQQEPAGGSGSDPPSPPPPKKSILVRLRVIDGGVSRPACPVRRLFYPQGRGPPPPISKDVVASIFPLPVSPSEEAGVEVTLHRILPVENSLGFRRSQN